MRQADLAGARQLTAADQRYVRDRVMRRAKRPLRQEPGAGRQQAGDGMDRRCLQRLVKGERRQDRGDASRHHRFSRAGRAHHQRVMAARGGDLQRPPRQGLPVDVGEVTIEPGLDGRGLDGCRRRRREAGGIVERRDRLVERADRIQAESLDDGRLGAIRIGQQQGAVAVAPGRGGDWQHATRLLNRAVEGQLAEHQRVVEIAPRQASGGGEQPERDRQIERGARLSQVGRGEVDGDAMRRKFEAAVADGAANAVAALAHARVGQSDEMEPGKSERDVDLDLDDGGVDAEDGGGANAGEHAVGACKRRCPPQSRAKPRPVVGWLRISRSRAAARIAESATASARS